VDVEVVIWRTIATGPSATRESRPELAEKAAAAKARRPARFDGRDIDTPVFARSDLAVDQVVDGPAIIEERETTIIILPGWTAKVHPTGCIMASKGPT
jgi:N-methylhydantoinase A